MYSVEFLSWSNEIYFCTERNFFQYSGKKRTRIMWGFRGLLVPSDCTLSMTRDERAVCFQCWQGTYPRCVPTHPPTMVPDLLTTPATDVAQIFHVDFIARPRHATLAFSWLVQPAEQWRELWKKTAPFVTAEPDPQRRSFQWRGFYRGK